MDEAEQNDKVASMLKNGDRLTFRGWPLAYDAWRDWYGFHIESWKSWQYHTEQGHVGKYTYDNPYSLVSHMDYLADLPEWQAQQEATQ